MAGGGRFLLVWSLLACTLACQLQSQAQTWELVPGITNRGEKPTTWTLDLRGTDKNTAGRAAAALSTRIYGRSNVDLHSPLTIRTDFSRPKILGLGISAVSSGGGILVVRTNGTEAGRKVWPAAEITHAVNRVLTLPLPAGPCEINLEVTNPAGVVVVDRYYLADSNDGLPQNPPPIPFISYTTPQAKAATARPADVPMTGGKLVTDDGYRGIWYYNQPVPTEYKFKYSGGFATYPYQHVPIAYYAKEVAKTFFVYGGTTARSASDKQELLHMVSYFDHNTGRVPRPRILLNKRTEDAHDNPTLQIDDQGHLWIFSSSHGTGRPSYIHRSVKPWSIDEFERILVTNFSYTQPWYVPGEGFLFLHTRYGGGKSLGINAARCLFWMTSTDGRKWEQPQMLAGIELGDYQVSWRLGKRVATAFDFHPQPGGLNARANIYYLETEDMGRTWQTVQKQPVKLPLSEATNPALIFNSREKGLLVYLRDLNFDRNGRPVILFVTSKGFEPGPENGPREWQTIHWSGQQWIRRSLTTSGNNYDHGSLYIEPDGTWRVIGPTDLGPQPYNPGGEMVMWTSKDEGQDWLRVKQLTSKSQYNHTFARRPVNAHPDFYALWADGHGRELSQSSIYFTNQRGDHVWRLPGKMETDDALPVIVE